VKEWKYISSSHATVNHVCLHDSAGSNIPLTHVSVDSMIAATQIPGTRTSVTFHPGQQPLGQYEPSRLLIMKDI